MNFFYIAIFCLTVCSSGIVVDARPAMEDIADISSNEQNIIDNNQVNDIISQDMGVSEEAPKATEEEPEVLIINVLEYEWMFT